LPTKAVSAQVLTVGVVLFTFYTSTDFPFPSS
jgi:hypothetical protein